MQAVVFTWVPVAHIIAVPQHRRRKIRVVGLDLGSGQGQKACGVAVVTREILAEGQAEPDLDCGRDELEGV